MRAEDNEKRERLKVLNRAIGLPFDEPHQFPATVVAAAGPEFQKFLNQHGEELCAIRLIPSDPTLPKLRMRGHSIREALKWFANQDIDPAKYRVDFVPHTDDNRWSTIFVVNDQGIFGEILYGSHNKLTQGLYEAGEEPVAFSYDFSEWTLNPMNADAKVYLKETVELLRVTDKAVQADLTSKLDAKFSHNYLAGYFETTNSKDFGTWFIDYNRILGDLYQGFAEPKPSLQPALVRGQVGSPGKATGRVRIVMPDDLESAQLEPGDILVCRMTTPDYLPLMQQAAAIVTDLGGILSHAAIVARELGKPCITATQDATSKLKEGQQVVVDAETGVVSAT
jgi:phosphohistidine swiveling domain-containing protein